MNEFIEKNRRLLSFYCVAARIIGWVLLIVPVITIMEACRVSTQEGDRLFILEIAQLTVLNHTLLGLVVLGVAQLIRYLVESRYQPGWILRNGDKILYVFSALVVLGAVVEHSFYVSIMKNSSSFTPLYFLSLVLRSVGKVSVLLGLAQILRRIIPVIEESKTLV